MLWHLQELVKLEHVAILREPYLSKIINGEKTIETRWSMDKRKPFGSISAEDIIYLKRSGGPVVAKCKVARALFFENLTKDKIKEIFSKYKKEVCFEDRDLEDIINKKYCTLIWLKTVEKLIPFEINKLGFGNMTAWIRIDKIDKIKI